MKRHRLTSTLLFATAVVMSAFGSASVHAQIAGSAPNFTLSSGTESDAAYQLTSSTLTQTGGTLNVGTFTLKGDSSYNISSGTGSFTDLQLGFMLNSSTISNAVVAQYGGDITVASNLQVGARNAISTGSSINAYYDLFGGTLTANSVTLYQVTGFTTTAYFELRGGSLTTSSILKGTGSGSYLHFNGGTLRAGPTDNFNWINSGITAQVGTGGAIFDTDGHTMGNYASLLHDPALDTAVDGGLTKKGASTLTLFYNVNTYTGATTLQEGTLSIGTDAALGKATNALNFSGGTLQIKRQAGQAAGTDPVDFGAHLLNTTTFNGGLDIADADHTFTLSQSLSGTGSLTKLGDGTLVLSAASTRSGATAVSAGTLRLTDSLTLQASPVTISGTGVLDFGTLTSATLGSLNATSFALQNGSATPLALTLGGGNTTAVSTAAFSGAGSLAKTGTGTITLSGTNTYTGSTTVNTGILQFANPTALSSTSTLTVTSGATAAFIVGGSGEFTLSGIGSILGSSAFQSGSLLGLDTTNASGGRFIVSNALTGSLGLMKLGGGFLTLSGANTYTGGTIVAAGALTGDSTSLQGNITNNAAINFDQNADGTYAGNMSGTGSLTKSYAGNLTLTGTNTYTGGTTINTGTLTGNSASLQGYILDNAALVFNQAATGTYAGVVVGTGSLTKSGAGNLTLSGANSYSGGTTVSAGTLTGNTTSLQGNITDNAALVFDQASTGTYAGVVSGTGSLTKSGVGNLTLSGANSYSGGTTVSAGTLTGNTTSLQGNITTNAALVFDQAAAGTYAGNLSGTGSLTKANTGTLTLTGASTHTGGTTISAGTLQIGAGGTSGSITGNITNNSALVFNRSDASAYSGVISGTGTLTKLGAGTLTLTGANTYTGATALNGGLVEFSTSNNFSTGSITLDGGGLRWATGNTLDISNRLAAFGAGGATFDTNSNNVTFATARSGTGALIKIGAGTLTLSAANTYTGGTVVNAGTLALSTGGPIGALVGSLTVNAGATLLTSTTNAFGYATGNKVDSATFNGGTLNYTGAADLGWGVTYTLSNSAFLSSNGGVSSTSSTSDFAFGGPSGGNTSVNVTSGTATIAGHADLRGDNGNTNVNFTVASGATLNVTAGISSHAPDSLTLGPVALTKLGGGTMILTGANTYTGATTINAGTLQAGNASAFGSGGTISFGGGTLQYGSGISTDFSSRFSTAASQAYTIDTNSQNVTFATALTSSGGSLTKSGSGTLTLSAANTYTGGTTVNAGTLTLNGAAGTGTGLIRGALTINSGATVNAASSNALGYNGSVKIDTVTLNGGTLDITSTADQGWGVAYILNGNGSTLTSNGGVSSSSTGSKFAFGNNSSLTVANNATATIAGRLDLRSDLNSNSNFTVGTGGNLAISAAITSSNGASPGVAGFTKLGAGTMTLTGANTYTGGTTISAGTLQFTPTVALPATGTLTVASGATAAFNVGGTGEFAWTGIAAQLGAGFQSGSLLGLDTTNATSGFTVSAIIPNANGGANPLGLVKLGTGTLTLTGANTFTGGATLGAGTVQIGNAAALGSTGTIGFTGGTLQYGSGITTDLSARFSTAANQQYRIDTNGQNVILAAALTSSGGALVKSGAGTLTLTGANTYTGATTINAGTLQIGNGGTSGSLTGNITNNAALVFNRSNALSYSGVISGSGSVTQGSSSSTLTLTGANTYTGGTMIYTGTISVAADSNLGSAAGTIYFYNRGTLQTTTSFTSNRATTVGVSGTGLGGIFDTASGTTLTWNGNIDGGSLQKNGTGTLILAGINTYDTLTYVKAGILALGRAGAIGTSVFTVGAGATLDTSTYGLDLSRANLDGGPGTITGSGIYSYNSSSDTGLGTSLAGSASLIKQGTGTLTLAGANTYTGGTTLGAGTVQIDNASALGSSGTISFASGTLQYGPDVTVDLSSRFSTDIGQQYRIDTNGQNITFASPLTTVSGFFTKLGAGALTLTAASTYSGGIEIAGGTLVLGNATAFGFSGINFTGGTLQYGPGITTDLSARFSTGPNQQYRIDTNGQDVTFAFPFANSSNSGSTFTKLGAGMLTLTGANTFYTGSAEIAAGTLQIGNAAALGNTGTIRFTGGTLRYGDSISTDFSPRFSTDPGQQYRIDTNTQNISFFTGLTSVGGTLTKLGAAPLFLNGANTYTGGTIVEAGLLSGNLPNNTAYTVNSGGTLAIGAPLTMSSLTGTAGAVSSTVGLNNAALTLNQSAPTATYEGGITGTGSFTKAGPGTFILTGASNYSGGTTIKGGELVFDRGSLLPPGSGDRKMIIGGATGDTGTLRILNAGVVSSSVGYLGNAVGSDNNSATVDGANSRWTTGAFAVGAFGSGNTLFIRNGGLVSASASTIGTYPGANNNSVTVDGPGSQWTNSGGLYLANSGTGNTLTIQNGGAVSASMLSIGFNSGSSGTLNIGAYDLSNTTGAGTLSTASVIFGDGAGTINFNQNDTTTFSAAISGGGSLNQRGTGKTVLTGANTYTGATAVDTGTLLVNGSLSGSTVTVSGNGTLGGTGSITGAVVENGVLSPGASIETLATGPLTMNASATFAFEVNSSVPLANAADMVVVNGGLNLTGLVHLTINDLAVTDTPFALGTAFTIINYSGTWNGGIFTYGSTTLAEGTQFSDGVNTWRINYAATTEGVNFTGDSTNANFVNLTAVPEPGTTLAMLGGLAILLGQRKRRR